MPSRTFPANKSSLFAGAGTDLGGGADDHLPVGSWSGYQFRSAVRFSLDFSGVKTIPKAVLRLRTSTQVHVGFSSSPDYVVRRATTDWSANSSSSSAEGGSGWGTSPTVYPGPSSSDSPMYTRAAPTSESTWTEINITGIVRKWAPVSAGGEGLPNYGVTLRPSGSSDVTEFSSYRASSGQPEIVMDYTTDAPPVAATPTGPTGTVTTLRPTITGTGSDPDGDTITAYGIEVRQGSTVVYSASTPGGTSYSHIPTADLPAGALTVRARATAAGVTGAWSADRAFTVDRLPVMGAWSAPAATVSGTRRPVHTIAWSDPDGDPGGVFDIEVWTADGAGHVTGTTPTYAKTNQTAGLSAASISHTPTVDLPGGSLGARVRVKTLGAWSAWSAWRFYTVVLTVPTLTWDFPTYDGGWAMSRANELRDPARPLTNQAVTTFYIRFAPPAGTTITGLNVTITVTDAGIGGPPAGTVILNSNVSAGVMAQGWYEFAFRPDSTVPPAPNWLGGTVRTTITLTASNAGQTIESRQTRFALGEWFGSVALGDSVVGLASVETPKLDDAAVLYRAQTSPTAASGGALWHPLSALATVEAGLPATNAYLGLRTRLFRRADDAQLQPNASFEDGLTGWLAIPANGGSTSGSSTAVDGSMIGRIGDVVAGNPQLQSLPLPVIPGATYRLSAWARRFGGTLNGRVRIDALNAAGGTVTASAVVLNYSTTAMTYQEGWYTVPADGSVATVRILAYIVGTTAVADVWGFDLVCVHGLGPGDAGMDRLALSWQSLG